MKAHIAEEHLLDAVELLRFVADVCACQPEELTVALCSFNATHYPAKQLRAEVIEVADRLAQALGFADSSLELAP